jgi:hypothetical protein
VRHALVTAVTIALFTTIAAFLFGRTRIALAVFMLLAVSVVAVCLATPRLAVSLLDDLILLLRGIHWRREQGRHHAFNNVPLHIVDDGRHVWVGGEGLQRVLGTHDNDDVLAARHAGRWRRDDGTLLLRVDAVVERLATGPGRLDPRTVRLRRYFEREVLFPAAERRRRDGL